METYISFLAGGSTRRKPTPGGGELDGLRDAIEGATVRLDRLEEERDFYKDLLDLPETRRPITPSAVEEDAADNEPG